jgi:exodeoxyribonuclease VIII
MKPGIYTSDQLSNEDYHRADGISKSGLDLILRSPAHYRFAEKREATRAMEIGTALHCAILEPERFASEYMLLRNCTDRRASEYKEAVKVWGTERVLTGTEADKVAGMQESVRSNPHLSMLAEPGRCELSVFATDPETGVLIKCRFDKLTDGGVAIDLKKTQDIRDFGKSVANYGYHMQEAFYRDVWEWATGERLAGFVFAAVEEQMPHASAPLTLDAEALDIGRMLYRKALNEYAECLNDDEWPGIACEPETIQLPSWYINQFETQDNLDWDGVAEDE